VIAVAASLEFTSRQPQAPWSDSLSLWTRVVSMDPSHEGGLYNLGVALAADGQPDAAAARFRGVLALVPGHPEATAEVHRLDAARLEREANDLAVRGDLQSAAERYRQAVTLDARRTHSHAALGMALATLGRHAEAIPVLREAVRQGTRDAAVPNALGVLLLESGQRDAARGVFEIARAAHPTDVGLTHNLARLLATSPGLGAKDRRVALDLARAAAEATGGRDARVLDTLAASLSANGYRDEAVRTSGRAAALAAQQGDTELAVQITARGRAYRNPGQ
jgi:Flp pilus assembly protein TadD